MFHSTHFSPLTGEPDVKENYHTLTYRLDYKGNKTTVSLSQDNNDSEKAVEHSRDNWEKMLRNLKDVIERSGAKA